jgi:L-rhamnose mutarotase
VQRVCFVLQVRPEYLTEYKQRHSEVWPEMLAALREAGWHNYSMFLRPDGLLVGYLEASSFQEAILEMKKHAVNERWQKEMAQFFESSKGEKPDDQMWPLEEIFHLA